MEAKETKQKKSLSQLMEEHPTATFISKLISWLIFALVLPLAFLMYRFDIFKTVSKVRISGITIIGIIIIAFVAITIIKYVKMAFSNKYSPIAQLLSGICKIIVPLVALIAILTYVRNEIDLVIQALYCVTACELVAIPLNPLPQWAYEKQKDVRVEERKETFDYLVDSFFKRKKEEEN